MTNKEMVLVPRELLERAVKAGGAGVNAIDLCDAWRAVADLKDILAAAPAEDARAVADEPVAFYDKSEDQLHLIAFVKLEDQQYVYRHPQRQVVIPEKYDDVLLPFLALMRAELHANAHKGDRPGWLSMDRKTAVLEVFYHMGKLHQAVHRNEPAAIREYAADVANMCMMLTDVCACIDECERLNK